MKNHHIPKQQPDFAKIEDIRSFDLMIKMVCK